MREGIAKFLNSKIRNSYYFVHADMWNNNRFNIISDNIIDVGLGESNLFNIVGGLMNNEKPVYVYGVCGFLIYRYEQLKLSLMHGLKKNPQAKVIILNAGKYGYDNLGPGHIMNDDLELMKILNIETFIPINREDCIQIIKNIERKPGGIYYIQLGKDE